MRRSGDRSIYGGLPAARGAAAFFCAVVAASSGCGGGAGPGNLVAQGNSFPATPGTSFPSPVSPGSPAPSISPTPLPTAIPSVPVSQQPALQLADLSQGASWKYLTYPGTAGGYSRSEPAPVASGYKYAALTSPGSSLTQSAGCAGADTGTPGAMIRLSGTAATAGVPYYHYDGTYRQDSATRDVYLLRLPTGEKLDSPAKVLPGTWSANTEIRSQFVVGGAIKAEYSLTVKGTDILETSLGSKAVWLVSTSIRSVGPKGKERLQTSKQWFEPTSGSYLQAMSRDAVMVLSDLTLVEILDDEKIISYKVNP